MGIVASLIRSAVACKSWIFFTSRGGNLGASGPVRCSSKTFSWPASKIQWKRGFGCGNNSIVGAHTLSLTKVTLSGSAKVAAFTSRFYVVLWSKCKIYGPVCHGLRWAHRFLKSPARNFKFCLASVLSIWEGKMQEKNFPFWSKIKDDSVECWCVGHRDHVISNDCRFLVWCLAPFR